VQVVDLKVRREIYRHCTDHLVLLLPAEDDSSNWAKHVTDQEENECKEFFPLL